MVAQISNQTTRTSPQNVQQAISKHMLVDVVPLIVDLERSKGNRIFCSKSSKYYLDCFGYIASNPIGHNHPLMFDKGFEEKLLRGSRAKPSNADFYTREMADFVETFARVALSKDFSKLFFIEGGALAVENGMKTAFDWKVRKNIEAGRSHELGTRILHFSQAFHGRTGYTLSVTNTADRRKTRYFPKFDWPRVLNPKASFPLDKAALAKVLDLEKRAEAQIRIAFQAHEHDIAGILIEPIQGEGGDNHFRPEFHQTLRSLADEYDALLIYDEVQSGLGLTGKMWAYQHYGMVPDILCFGKKTQVCGIMVGERVLSVKNNVFEEASRINSTWGGSLSDMVRSERYLEIIEQEKLVENAKEVGDYLLTQLQSLVTEFPTIFSNARGKGLMAAIDAENPTSRDRLFLECFKRDTLILKCGRRSLRLRPSLTFAKTEVDELMAVMRESAKA